MDKVKAIMEAFKVHLEFQTILHRRGYQVDNETVLEALEAILTEQLGDEPAPPEDAAVFDLDPHETW